MVGIVPEPIKTSKNMAYYDPASVEIIKVAKELRSRNIPISSVKDILHKYGTQKTNELLTQSKDITLALLGPLKPPHSNKTESELSAYPNITQSSLKDLEMLGLVKRDESGLFDSLSVELVEVLSKMREQGMNEDTGFEPKDMQLYIDAIGNLLEHELEYFNKRLLDQVNPEEYPNILHAALEHAETLCVVVRRRLLLNMLQRMEKEPQTLNESYSA